MVSNNQIAQHQQNRLHSVHGEHAHDKLSLQSRYKAFCSGTCQHSARTHRELIG
jgi:hypothetical protein